MLGVAFSWGVPMAFAATVGDVPRVGWLLFLATVIWVVVYDTQYAMTDRPDDVKIGVRSTAILFGELDRVFIAGLQVLLLASLVLVGRSAAMGVWYYGGLAAAALFCVYQAYLIKERDIVQSFRAFLNNAWFGGAVFAGILLDYTFRPERAPAFARRRHARSAPRRPPASSAASALTVAPVVTTSSTIAIARPARSRSTRNARATLARRSRAPCPVCAGVAERRAMPRSSAGTAASRPACARSPAPGCSRARSGARDAAAPPRARRWRRAAPRSSGASSNANARPERARAAVLQRVQVVVERRPVRERRDDGVDVPRHLRARAVADGPREPAAAAWVRARARTRGADAQKPPAERSAAGRAALDEQPAQEPVNHGAPARLTARARGL